MVVWSLAGAGEEGYVEGGHFAIVYIGCEALGLVAVLETSIW